MPLLDRAQTFRHLRADRDEGRAMLPKAGLQIALVIGQGEVTRRATFESEEDQHEWSALEQFARFDATTIDLGQVEWLHLVSGLYPLGRVGRVDQRLSLVDVDLQFCRVHRTHSLRVKVAEDLMQGFLLTHDNSPWRNSGRWLMIGRCRDFAGKIVSSRPRASRRAWPPIHGRAATNHGRSRWRLGAARIRESRSDRCPDRNNRGGRRRLARECPLDRSSCLARRPPPRAQSKGACPCDSRAPPSGANAVNRR